MSSLPIDPKKSPGGELGRVLVDLSTEAGFCIRALQADPNEAIHGLRTTMKKLRSGLLLARSELPESGVGRVLELVVDLKNAVSLYRDREVLRHCIINLAVEIERDKTHPGFLQTVAADIFPVYFPELRGIPKRLVSKLALQSHELRRQLESMPFWAVTRRGLGNSLRRTHSKVIRWGKICRKSSDAADFHEWRKAVKHQATQCLILEKLFRSARTYRRDAEALGETLGEINDYENLNQLLRNTSVSSPCVEPILERIAGELASLRKRARRLAK